MFTIKKIKHYWEHRERYFLELIEGRRRSRGRRGGRNRHHSGNRQNRPQNAASAPEAQAQDAE